MNDIPLEHFYKHRDFMFSCVAHEKDMELGMLVKELEDYLNHHISLRDYTREILSIGYIPIVRWEYDPRERTETSYDKIDREIYIQNQVFPSENLQNYPPEQAWLHNLGRKLIKSLQEFEDLIPPTLLQKLEEVIDDLLHTSREDQADDSDSSSPA